MTIARIRGAAAALAMIVLATPAMAAQCGNNAGGFEARKKAFAPEAKAAGGKSRGLQALAGTTYAS
nr:murein transglycosylase [Rhizobiaceae bacterium]